VHAGRRLRPMLVAVAVTEAAEAGIAVLLLLRLQRHFDLEVLAIAAVFLPGAIALAVLPPYLHRLVLVVGRRRVLAGTSIASAVFAGTLAWAPIPIAIAVLWVLSAAAWAAAQPIQQAVITEAAGSQAGRGLGLYEAAALAGTAAGGLAAGALFDAAAWELACLTFAAIILAGCAILPAAVRRLRVADLPRTR
jgi:MFS transporter, DHA1 family, multidrug resistance protein